MRFRSGTSGHEDLCEALVTAVEDAGFEAKLLDRGEGQETVVLKVCLCAVDC